MMGIRPNFNQRESFSTHAAKQRLRKTREKYFANGKINTPHPHYGNLDKNNESEV